jgi:hypothetical protein
MVRQSGRRERPDIDGDAARLPRDHGRTLEGNGESHVLYRMPGHLIRRLQQVAVSLFVEEVGSANITPVQYAAHRECRGTDAAAVGPLGRAGPRQGKRAAYEVMTRKLFT